MKDTLKIFVYDEIKFCCEQYIHRKCEKIKKWTPEDIIVMCTVLFMAYLRINSNSPPYTSNSIILAYIYIPINVQIIITSKFTRGSHAM